MAIGSTDEYEPKRKNDRKAEQLMLAHYETLKQIARAKRRRAGSNQTMLTTDLLHESWLKLRHHDDWENEAHFLHTAALAMRQVLVDCLRKKLSQKRGSGASHLSYEEVAECLPEFSETPEQIVVINNLLDGLGEVKPRLAELVNLRYFGGFTERETARILGITSRTVRRDWLLAKAWLAAEMGGDMLAESVPA
jgi:RNA polymerase sigma factor (TIGR02999 family)